MKKLLISVEFRHNKDGWSWDSGIQNRAVDYKPEKETIHQLVKRVCEYKGMELTHNGRALGTLFIEDEDGNRMTNGYAYRGKSMTDGSYGMKPKMVYWSVFVHIAEIKPFNFKAEEYRRVKPVRKSLMAA
jgi:hypothetical protein